MGGWTDGQMNRQTDEGVHGWTDRQMNGEMDEWMDRWIDCLTDR